MKQIISTVVIAGFIIFASSCTTSADHQRDAMIKEQQAQIDALKMEMVKKQVIDSMNAIALTANKPEKEIKVVTQKTYIKPTPKKVYTSNYSSGHGGAYSEPVQQPPVYQTAQQYPAEQPIAVQQQKKGWSAKAKGAVIGTAVGAGAGAIINKRNRAAGAVIGAVLGAGAGTGIGAVIDKKNGR